MDKTLKGKECGKGIYQRKDGLYHTRFVDKLGKRKEMQIANFDHQNINPYKFMRKWRKGKC